MLFKREYFTSMMYYISILIRAEYICLPQLSFRGIALCELLQLQADSFGTPISDAGRGLFRNL